MPACINLAIDATGGDHGAAVVVPAVLQALTGREWINATLFGDQQLIESLLGSDRTLRQRIAIEHRPNCIGMEQRPADALKTGAGTSMWSALQSVAEGRCDAAVSAGNTGALMVLSRKLIGMLPGLDRPALMSWLPRKGGHTHLLDLGANVGSKPEHLVQFAIMGAVTAELVDQQMNPAIGLLNVGREDGKGDGALQTAHQALQRLPINYVGFIEGHDIYQGEIDVAVCDGMVGNLVLKSGEGLARLLCTALEDEFDLDWHSRLQGKVAKSAIRRWLERFDPAAHNGAAMLGLNKVVVKSHGDASAEAYACAILTAAMEAERQVPRRIQERVAQYAIGTMK